MTGGRVVGNAWRPQPVHRCAPPVEADSSNRPIPALPPGTVWRCDCGVHWTAREYGWLRSTWWERRRATRGTPHRRAAMHYGMDSFDVAPPVGMDSFDVTGPPKGQAGAVTEAPHP
jgi:hypothetical protein